MKSGRDMSCLGRAGMTGRDGLKEAERMLRQGKEGADAMQRLGASACQLRTGADVKEDFLRRGKSISEWARDHGFRRELVFAVLDGRSKGYRGDAHKIAVLLGMKDGIIED